MLQRLLVAAFVLLASPLEQPKPIPKQCLTRETLRNALSQNIPGVELATFKGRDAENFIEHFNAIPPNTGIQADVVLLASMKSSPQVVIAFFDHDCMMGRAVLPRQVIDQLLLQIERGGA